MSPVVWFPFTTPLVAVVLSAASGQGIETYGPLGAALLGLAIFVREMVRGEVRRAEAAEARLEKLTDQFMTQALPVLNNATEILRHRGDVDKRLLEALEKLV